MLRCEKISLADDVHNHANSEAILCRCGCKLSQPRSVLRPVSRLQSPWMSHCTLLPQHEKLLLQDNRGHRSRGGTPTGSLERGHGFAGRHHANGIGGKGPAVGGKAGSVGFRRPASRSPDRGVLAAAADKLAAARLGLGASPPPPHPRAAKSLPGASAAAGGIDGRAAAAEGRQAAGDTVSVSAVNARTGAADVSGNMAAATATEPGSDAGSALSKAFATGRTSPEQPTTAGHSGNGNGVSMPDGAAATAEGGNGTAAAPQVAGA
jgi:hypothetical protein